ncbi:MmgE/PrpD family protein [Caballeronia ptereochthonis]|uniref:MmgE/PrpD family protein n=1 Tax=Caballeronia ptereochthonis TaxID=1777144 RepID=A0A158AYL6_9BURK|nr:MmgE/PrpD family protein [Caballeronia ptereochthonis]SAK62546.1 MmgE/PrpD family protein [Caballeronia ptereochthonis]
MDDDARQGRDIEVTRLLAEHAVRLVHADVPPAVVDEAKRALVDYQGVALAGSREPLIGKLKRVYAVRGGAPEARLIGEDRKTDALTAAFINCASGHALDFDDTHADFFYHGSVPVAAAVWSVGEMLRASGRDVLLAFVAGWDVGARIARALNPSIYDQGWQNTPTSGTFAATVAAGKLLRLDADQMRHALGMAASQASGSRQNHGSMGKPFQVGKAAMNGVLAALAAREGVTSSMVAIEAPLGFAMLTARTFDLRRAVDGLGDRFELQRNMYKPYACCLPHHAAIDAMFALRHEHGVMPEHVERIVCQMPAGTLDASTSIDEPSTGLQGKFSARHSAAVALTDDAAGLAQYTDERVRDARLAPLRRAIDFVADKTLERGQCIAEAKLRDGSTVSVRVDHPRGQLANPLSDEELVRKFCANVGGILDAGRQTRALQRLWALETADDIAEVADML